MGSEEDLQRLAELRAWLERRVEELESEAARLRELMGVIDNLLKRESFIPAAELTRVERQAEAAPPSGEEYQEVKTLTDAKTGQVLATAHISARSVAIVPASDLQLHTATPPFRTYLLNRVLEGMKSKDQERAARGEIPESEVLSYTVEESAGVLKRLMVYNYRDQRRLNEVLSNARWTFSRMLEKEGR